MEETETILKNKKIFSENEKNVLQKPTMKKTGHFRPASSK